MPVQILLIEDEPALRAEILEHLIRRRHRVIAVGSLAEALEALDGAGGTVPDAIVSDIRLPDGDGVHFYVENARRFPNTRWILMSGNHDLVRVGNQLKSAGDLPPCAVVDKPLPLRLMDRFLEAIPTSTPVQGGGGLR
ncbi:MAG TPA: response regulator [Reyranellaceae bacterium]|nr:response regulator [Reyranellaceae bacterium]